jgi:hypothetical protein
MKPLVRPEKNQNKKGVAECTVTPQSCLKPPPCMLAAQEADFLKHP